MTSKLLKVVLLGDGGVGKSSLMNRFVCDKFDAQSFHTIGVEFLNKDVLVDGKLYTMQIWDTAGQERFKSLRTPFYRGTDCCLLTFSVDNKTSFRNLAMWYEEFVNFADVQDASVFPFIVLGNKADMDNREVSTEEAQDWCTSHGRIPYFETSAKNSTNVEKAFLAAVNWYNKIEADLEDKQVMKSSTVDLRQVKKSKSCC